MEPVIKGEWLKDGATLIGAGPTPWRAREVDEATIARADKLVVDSNEQAMIEAGDLCSAVDRGIIQWSKVHELRHVVAKTVQGRDSEGQVVYAKIMGPGVADVAAAKLAYDLAKENGLGTEIEWGVVSLVYDILQSSRCRSLRLLKTDSLPPLWPCPLM